MTLDKDDLLRNAAPGYVFMTVLASFIAISDHASIIGSQAAFVGLFAGYPIGSIIQIIYRTIFHVTMREQGAMEANEAKLLLSEISKTLKKDESVDDVFFLHGNRRAGLLLALTTKRYFKEYRARLEFLVGYMHFLGASILAICFSLTLVWCLLFFGTVKNLRPETFLCFEFFWAMSLLIFFVARRRTKEGYCLTLEMVVAGCKEKLKEFLVEIGVVRKAGDDESQSFGARGANAGLGLQRGCDAGHRLARYAGSSKALKAFSMLIIILATAGFAYTWHLTNKVSDIHSRLLVATAALQRTSDMYVKYQLLDLESTIFRVHRDVITAGAQKENSFHAAQVAQDGMYDAEQKAITQLALAIDRDYSDEIMRRVQANNADLWAELQKIKVEVGDRVNILVGNLLVQTNQLSTQERKGVKNRDFWHVSFIFVQLLGLFLSLLSELVKADESD